MADTKNYYDQILENQNKLMAVLTEFANEAVDTMIPATDWSKKMSVLANEYFTRPFQLTQELTTKENLEKFQEDFWTNWNESYQKSMEMNMDLYRKTMDSFQSLWKDMINAGQQERMKKMTSLFQDFLKAFAETTNANTKVMQDYMV